MSGFRTRKENMILLVKLTHMAYEQLLVCAVLLSITLPNRKHSNTCPIIKTQVKGHPWRRTVIIEHALLHRSLLEKPASIKYEAVLVENLF